MFVLGVTYGVCFQKGKNKVVIQNNKDGVGVEPYQQ